MVVENGSEIAEIPSAETDTRLDIDIASGQDSDGSAGLTAEQELHIWPKW